MKIVFIYDNSNEMYKKLVNGITESLESSESKENVVISNKFSPRSKCDIYVVVSDNILEIKKYSEKILDKNRILILTENLASSHVINCIEITPNVCYMKNDINVISKKICAIFSSEKTI